MRALSVCSHLHEIKRAIGNEEHFFPMLRQLLQHRVALLTVADIFPWKENKRKTEGVWVGGAAFYLYSKTSLRLNYVFISWQRHRRGRIISFVSPNKAISIKEDYQYLPPRLGT